MKENQNCTPTAPKLNVAPKKASKAPPRKRGRVIRKKSAKRRNLLFDPAEVLTGLQQAINCDFKQAQHVYCLNDSTTLYGFNRQVNELGKKFKDPNITSNDCEQKAYAKFLGVNARMADINLKLREELDFDETRCPTNLPRNKKIHLRARQLIAEVLGELDEEEWFTLCRHGTGTSLGVPFKDTSLEAKSRFPLTATKRAEPWFDRYLTFDATLKASLSKHNGGTESVFPLERYRRVPGSRATTVDKTNEIDRFICIEPTVNMHLQQGLMLLIYVKLRDIGLDVGVLPDLHRLMAQVSSITLLKATVDWASASDCVARELLRRQLPTKWFNRIDALRCTHTEINGELVELHMISSMGNATTFPLELLIFWTYAVAIYMTDHTSSNSLFATSEDKKSCSVFGDDCIVPTPMAESYMAFMEGLGFIVNREKSFFDTQMRFRESCGGDFLDGYDVRPHHVRAPASTKLSALEPWLYIQLNALIPRYIKYFGRTSYVYEKQLFAYISKVFARYNLTLKIVPPDFPDDAGLIAHEDVHRLVASYRFKMSGIDRDRHGRVYFKYCSFRYKSVQQEWNEDLRFATQLRKLLEESKDPTDPLDWESGRNARNLDYIEGLGRKLKHVYRERKNGGYVVAKSSTAHWTVPVVDRKRCYR